MDLVTGACRFQAGRAVEKDDRFLGADAPACHLLLVGSERGSPFRTEENAFTLGHLLPRSEYRLIVDGSGEAPTRRAPPRRMRKSPTAAGTRMPAATVCAFCHNSA